MMIHVLLVLLALAQQPPPQPAQTQTFGAQRTSPPRDGVEAGKKGAGVIRGRITNTEGRPLRRVQLRLSGEAIPEGRTASTNGLGKFEIRDLPAGRFNLTATRAGYLPMSFGQTRVGEPGRPIELAAPPPSTTPTSSFPTPRSCRGTSSTRPASRWPAPA
jgi:hypothetical protein